MKRTIITISRQYGSGGRAIGETIARDLHIPFYDRNLVDMVARATHLKTTQVEHPEEMSSAQIAGLAGIGRLNTFLTGAQTYSAEETIYMAQEQLMKAVAAQGSGVFVGRLADYILRDDPDQIRAFVFASDENRIARIMREYGAATKDEAIKAMRAQDRRRALYARRFADRDWSDLKNYHIIVDSGALGIKRAAKAIEALVL